MRQDRTAPRAAQSGSALLFVVLMLLIAASLLTYGTSRTLVVEQRIANNERQSIAARAAAQGGLEYALAWLRRYPYNGVGAIPAPPDLPADNGATLRTRLQPAAPSIEPDDTSQPVCIRAVTEAREPALANAFRARQSQCFEQTGLFASDADLGSSMPTPSCTGTDCIWRRLFALSFTAAAARAKAVGHTIAANEPLPCGPTAPGLYLLQRTADITAAAIVGNCQDQSDGVDDTTIGSRSQPVIILVPAALGCPNFTADVTIHGIIYYQSATACAEKSWAGAQVYGAVMSEDNNGTMRTHRHIIATDYGSGGELNARFQVVDGARRIPGSWQDW